MSPVQNVRAHIAMQRPRTRVGKISEQRMLGTGPNPMTKQQKYAITLMVEIVALATEPMSTMLPMTSTISDIISTGIVDSRRDLQEEESSMLIFESRR